MNKEFFLLMLFVIFINLSSCNFRLYKDADLIDVEDIINRYNEEETMSFNNYLISSFSSEIKEENGIYYFSYKGYTYSYDSNNKKVTRKENEEESYDYLFNSFTEAKSASLKVGDVIKTSCFYRFSSHGRGKELYTIVEDNKGLDLPLDNGLFARITGRVSFENLGGYGNNFYNDSPLFDKIFQYKDNYDFKYLYFESDFYVCLSQINMYEVNDLCFIGNNSRLVVNDEYIDTKYNEFFLNISNCHNLLFVNFGVDYDFTKQMNGIKTQVGIHNSKNLEFVKCEYNILNNYRDIQNEVTNFDCYQGWENIIINKCKFNNLSDVEAGGSLWIRDFRNVGSKNIKVLNSSFHKMAHDEIIAVFQGKVEDVLIRNNKFLVEENGLLSSVMNFTFGSGSSIIAKNISFIGNEVNTIASGGLIWSNGDNVIIKDNIINVSISKYSKGNFRLFESTGSERMISLIENNNINLKSNLENSEYQTHVFNKVDKISNNKISIDCKITDLFLNCNNINDNEITIDEAEYVAYNVKMIFTNNEININNHFGALFRYYGLEMNNDVDLTNNVINYNYEENEDDSCLIMLNDSKMNNYIISFNENKIFTKKINKKSRILFFYPLDNNKQTMHYLNNEIDGYQENHYLVNINVISSLD